jgi:hypothetical protein
MAASTRASPRPALLPAEGVPDGVVAGRPGPRRDGLGAAGLSGDWRLDSGDLDADGPGVWRGGSKPVRQGADLAAEQAADGV